MPPILSLTAFGSGGGVSIATVSAAHGNDPLVISFSATMKQIQVVINLIGSRQLFGYPSTASRTVSIQLTDAAMGSQHFQTRTLRLTATNDTPVLTIRQTALATIEMRLVYLHSRIHDCRCGSHTIHTTTATLTVTTPMLYRPDRLQFAPGRVYAVVGNQLIANGNDDRNIHRRKWIDSVRGTLSKHTSQTFQTALGFHRIFERFRIPIRTPRC